MSNVRYSSSNKMILEGYKNREFFLSDFQHFFKHKFLFISYYELLMNLRLNWIQTSVSL